MNILDLIADKLKIMHKVKSIPNKQSKTGFYFIHTDDGRKALYIVSNKTLFKIFDNVDYYTQNEINSKNEELNTLISNIGLYRKVYNSFSAMQADVKSPMADDGNYISSGQLVLVANPNDTSRDGQYKYLINDSDTKSWVFSGGQALIGELNVINNKIKLLDETKANKSYVSKWLLNKDYNYTALELSVIQCFKSIKTGFDGTASDTLKNGIWRVRTFATNADGSISTLNLMVNNTVIQIITNSRARNNVMIARRLSASSWYLKFRDNVNADGCVIEITVDSAHIQEAISVGNNTFPLLINQFWSEDITNGLYNLRFGGVISKDFDPKRLMLVEGYYYEASQVGTYTGFASGGLYVAKVGSYIVYSAESNSFSVQESKVADYVDAKIGSVLTPNMRAFYYLNGSFYDNPNGTYIMKVSLKTAQKIGGCSLYLNRVSQVGSWVEFSIFNRDWKCMATSLRQEINATRKGLTLLKTEEKVLPAGDYYIMIVCNTVNEILSANTQMLFNNNAEAYYLSDKTTLLQYINYKSQSLKTPLPILSDDKKVNCFPAFSLIGAQNEYKPLFDMEFQSLGTIRMLAPVNNNSQAVGWNTNSTKRNIVITSDGVNFTDLMKLSDEIVSQNPQDAIVYNAQLYLLTYDKNTPLWRSSDMTATATWENVTPPDWTKGIAYGRNYSLAIWRGKLWIGEYNGITANTNTNKPKVHCYNGSAWSVSRIFNARHIHCMYPYSNDILFCVVGDLANNGNFGDEYGIWRLTSSNEETNHWIRWTEEASYPYPVNLCRIPSLIDGGTPDLLGSGDTPPCHLQRVFTAGSVGDFIVQPSSFRIPLQPNDTLKARGETCRSVEIDDNLVAYYVATEGEQTALFCSAPPYYNDAHKIGIYNNSFVSRTVIFDEWVLNGSFKCKKASYGI